MENDFSPGLQWLLGGTIAVYIVVMYAVSYWAQGQISTAKDFVVAGRRLPLSLAWLTLLATWFGAATLLTVADEVRQDGLRMAAMDPLGAGCCLILAGVLVARRLWEMDLLTVGDFFRIKFGRTAEITSSLILVPSYFGWVAAQFVALAGMFHVFFGLELNWGITLVAVVGTGYTLMGGMWSVTLTDAIQMSLVLLGLIVLAFTTLSGLGNGNPWDGLMRVHQNAPPEHLIVIPRENLNDFFVWLTAFCVGALGNLPGQDLLQRVFSAKSAKVAQRACVIAGVLYLVFGAIPLVLALSVNLIDGVNPARAILPALAHAFLSPPVAVIFTVALLSAVLSTIDSAILSPASVLAENVLPRLGLAHVNTLMLNRASVLFVALASTVLAYRGESAYELLDSAYSLVLVALFVPLVIGLYTSPRSGLPAMGCMLTGVGLWFGWYAVNGDWLAENYPRVAALDGVSSLLITGLGLVAYLGLAVFDRVRLPAAKDEPASVTPENE